MRRGRSRQLASGEGGANPPDLHVGLSLRPRKGNGRQCAGSRMDCSALRIKPYGPSPIAARAAWLSCATLSLWRRLTMHNLWGIAIVLLSVLCWGGQTISWLAPATAVKLTLMEAEDDVEPTYWADIRGEASWDFFTLWTMVVAGVLLVLDSPAWAYLGLIGGGMYVYFSGRGIFTRVAMRRRGFRVGAPRNLKLGYTLLAIWGVMGLATIVAAVVALSAS